MFCIDIFFFIEILYMTKSSAVDLLFLQLLDPSGIVQCNFINFMYMCKIYYPGGISGD